MRATVIGSGVAGLAVSELLCRNGWAVTLIEATADLGGDASRRTQDWWHTGWLYAGLPDPSATVTSVQALSALISVYGESAWAEWYLPREMLFAFALNDLIPGVNRAWRAYVDRRIVHRMKSLGKPGVDVSPPPALAELMCRWEDSIHGPSRYRTVRSTDEGIDTAKVLRWMASHLPEAEVVTGADVAMGTLGSRTMVSVNGQWDSPDLIVVAAGAGIRDLLMPVEPRVARSFTTVRSPILVTPLQDDWPAFIRYTADLSRTVNHQPYPTPSGWVSTLGSHDELGPDGDEGPFIERLRHMLPFDRYDGVYLGAKTEYTNGKGRRYNHAVVDAGRGCLAVVPGKFSQFPLLVEAVATRLGLRLDLDPVWSPGIEGMIGATEPERLAASGMLAPA
jgi:hypothetical protein